jgi:hypothetical protein
MALWNAKPEELLGQEILSPESASRMQKKECPWPSGAKGPICAAMM